MNNDLKEILRSVLKEEMMPFNKRLDGFEQHFNTLGEEITGIKENHLNNLANDIKELKDGQARLSEKHY